MIGLHGMVLNYYNVWIMQAINQGLRNALLERWHRLSLTYHGDHRVGDSVYRIFQDSAQVTNVIAVVMRMAQTLIMYLMTLLFVTALDPVLGTLILVVSGVRIVMGAVVFSADPQTVAQRAGEQRRVDIPHSGDFQQHPPDQGAWRRGS